jgi:hypothetical protein
MADQFAAHQERFLAALERAAADAQAGRPKARLTGESAIYQADYDEAYEDALELKRETTFIQTMTRWPTPARPRR